MAQKNGRFPTWEPTVCVMGLYKNNFFGYESAKKNQWREGQPYPPVELAPLHGFKATVGPISLTVEGLNLAAVTAKNSVD